MGSAGLVATAWPFASSWLPSEKTQAAGAPVQVNVDKLEYGQKITVEWRGKPVWIIRRAQAILDSLKTHINELRDPDSLVDQQPAYAKNPHRSIYPEFLVLVGICTHLGCVPGYQPTKGGALGPSWQGGFFCPCHGSTFDLAGRVFQGVPAPINLEVPPYRFLSEKVILVGEHHQESVA